MLPVDIDHDGSVENFFVDAGNKWQCSRRCGKIVKNGEWHSCYGE